MSFFCSFYYRTSLTFEYQSLCKKFQIKAYMNEPELLRKCAYKPQEESYSEAQNEAAIPRCISVDSLRIGAQGKWFLNSYRRKSEQMFPKALLSSVGQSSPFSPFLQEWSLTALASSPGYSKGPSPACSCGTKVLSQNFYLLLGCSLSAK